MNFSAVILAGGQALRMGCDKAFLEIDGMSLLARQIENTRTAGAKEIFISGRPDVDYAGFSLPVLHDAYSDVGPLAGIHAALVATQQPFVLTLAVDMLMISPTFLPRLVEASEGGRGVVPRVAGRVEPLVAIYPRAGLDILAAMLKEKNFAARKFAEACVLASLAVYQDIPVGAGQLFKNVNHPEDMPCLA